MADIPEWLEALSPSAAEVISRVIDEGESLIDDLLNQVSSADPSQYVDEDHEDRNKLVRLDVAIDALYRLRNRTAQQEIPTWLGLATAQMVQEFQQCVSVLSAICRTWNTGHISELRAPLLSVVNRLTPRGVIGRFDKVRRELEIELRGRHLFAKSERRTSRKVSSRRAVLSHR